LKAFFGEGVDIEDGFDGGRRGGGEYFGHESSVLYVVEREAGSVRNSRVVYGVEVAGGNARFEDEVAVRIGYTGAVIYYNEMTVAAVL
jgi:hypothetical protein